MHCRTEAQDYWRIYTKGMHCARANCREEYVVGGSELATTTQNMVQQRTTVPFALWQNFPKLSKIVQNCPYWCKVVQIGLELSKLFLVINIFSTFSQLYNFQLQKIHIDSYFDSFRMKKT